MADIMNAVVRDLFASRRQTPPIVIGRAGEYGATTVTFDLRGFIDRYGTGTPSLLHKRPPDDEAYIVPPSATDTETHDWVETPDEATLVWHVGQVATSYVGNGTIELQWRLPGTTSKKTAQFDVVVLGAIGNPVSEIPNAQQIYLDVMQGIADDAEDAADRAEAATEHYPKIVNGNWYVWDAANSEWVNTGVSARGPAGDTGDSAYEEAVELGFVGTEAEWIASLKGEKGDKGDPGADAEGAVRYDETQTLTDAQKNTACGNIGAIGQLEYDAIQQSLSALDADISLKADEADIPTKVSDLTNDTGFVTAQQAAAAAPVKSVNGKTGIVTLSASDVGALADDAPVLTYASQQLTDAQKAIARANIGAVGKLEYDALESDIESLEADISLKLDAADAPTKVSDLQNDTGYITASQVPAAPVQSVNGKTGSVTVNEVPAVGSTDSKKVLTADNGTYSWAAVPTGETTKRISLYKNSQTGVYTCSMTATQLHDALPNVVLSTEDYRVPVSAYSIDKDDSYVKAVFIDDRPENNAAIVWTLSAASASDLVAVTREECSIEGLPDYSHAIDGQVLTKAQDGPRWANNNPSSGAALRLLYDGAFGPDDPDLMLMGNVADAETGNAIATALYYGRIGSAVLVDVTDPNTEVVYDLFAVDYDAQTHVSTVVFARTEGALIRTATLSGSTKTAPVFGTIPIAGGSADAVLYTPQSLTDSQKAQARTNVGAGTYSKPSGGIPASDLASAVQTSLGKADTAVQPSAISDMATKTWVEGKGYQTAADVQTAIAAIPDELPAVTSSDNGKFLRVVSGAWAAQTVPSYQGGSY